MLTLKQMRYFDALATTLHFGRAAELAHVSQPALSAQIGELERHLGLKLVERGRGATILTRDGERLLPRIRAILAEVGLLEANTAGRGVMEGLMRLGIIPTVAPYLVPSLVPRLRGRHRGIEIELKESITANLVDDLKIGRLDAIVAAMPLDDDGLVVEALFEDRFLIAGSEDADCILVSPMAQEEVDATRLLLLEEGHCLRDQALAVCSAADGRRLVNYGATSMATLLQMVGHGMGLTLVPEIALAAEAGRHSMRFVRFATPEPLRTVCLAWRRGSARKADFEQLGQTITECARAIIEEGCARLNDRAGGSPAKST